MKLLLMACLGGALGAGLRHIANVTAIRTLGIDVAWATFSVNVLGSLFMGGLIAYLFARMPDAVGLRTLLATGMLGGLTTFSAFSLETVAMIERGSLMTAAAYVLGSVALSIAGCFVAYAAMRAALA